MSLNLNKDQRSFTLTVIVLLVILVAVTAWNRPKFDVSGVPQVSKKKFDYNAYLASLKIDPNASQKLLKQVVDEKQIKAEIEKELGINQKITIPTIPDSKLSISSASSEQTMTDYFKSVGEEVSGYNGLAAGTSENLFGQQQSSASLDQLQDKTNSLIQKLYAIKVPKDAVGFHKAVLGMYESYADTIMLAKAYNSDPDLSPWPSIYRDYSVINSQISALDDQFKNVDGKYHLSDVVILNPVARDNGLIPTAHALLGVTVVIKDIPGLVKDAVEAGLANAFANFATQYLNKLIVTIENNYKIANFLYYSDALVRGQYVDDYLDKYVADPLDRKIVTNFIPQFACSQAGDLKDVFKAKADQYLGFDPENLDPGDPDFNVKLARVGDFLASPSGWELYYEGIAEQAQSEAEKAVDRELASSGLKSPRDAVGTQIAASLNSIAESETAAFISTLNLGTSNVDKLITKIVSSVTYNLFNKFVFRGAVVYEEQKTCVPIPQLKPIIPASDTGYQEPPAPPSEDDLGSPYLNPTPTTVR